MEIIKVKGEFYYVGIKSGPDPDFLDGWTRILFFLQII